MGARVFLDVHWDENCSRENKGVQFVEIKGAFCVCMYIRERDRVNGVVARGGGMFF